MIRKTLLYLAIVALSTVASAQHKPKKVPDAVVSSFSDLYPSVDPASADWDKECGYYEAKFKENGKEHKAYFEKNGEWISSELKDVNVQELPQQVIDGLYTSEYGGWKAQDVTVKYNNENVVYDIEVKKGLKERDVQFDENGNIKKVN